MRCAPALARSRHRARAAGRRRDRPDVRERADAGARTTRDERQRTGRPGSDWPPRSLRNRRAEQEQPPAATQTTTPRSRPTTAATTAGRRPDLGRGIGLLAGIAGRRRLRGRPRAKPPPHAGLQSGPTSRQSSSRGGCARSRTANDPGRKADSLAVESKGIHRGVEVSHEHLRAQMVKAGVWLTIASCVAGALYALATWDDSNRGLLIALFGVRDRDRARDSPGAAGAAAAQPLRRRLLRHLEPVRDRC